MRRTKKAFTLTELLVVIFIIGILIGILLPALNAAFEEARKIRCSTSLKAVGDGLRTYVTSNGGLYPDLGHPAAAVWKNIGWNYASSSVNNTAVITGNTRALYSLLVKSGVCTADVFICPSAANGFGQVAVLDSLRSTSFDFPCNQIPIPASPITVSTGYASLNISYSYQNIWGPRPGPTTSEQMVVMADRNPQFIFKNSSDGTVYATPNTLLASQTAGVYQYNRYFAVSGKPLTANSPNHGYKGQNVLFADSHVKWYNTPLCGLAVTVSGNTYIDNIYTYADGSQYGSTPASDGDALFSSGAGATLDTWLVP